MDVGFVLPLPSRVRRPMTKNGLQGALDLLILKVLPQLGSLCFAFARMEQGSWVRAGWAVTAYGRKAKWYALTSAGNEHLASREKNRAQVAKGRYAILRFA